MAMPGGMPRVVADAARRKCCCPAGRSTAARRPPSGDSAMFRVFVFPTAAFSRDVGQDPGSCRAGHRTATTRTGRPRTPRCGRRSAGSRTGPPTGRCRRPGSTGGRPRRSASPHWAAFRWMTYQRLTTDPADACPAPPGAAAACPAARSGSTARRCSCGIRCAVEVVQVHGQVGGLQLAELELDAGGLVPVPQPRR